jgi:hypothetical protein
VYIMFDITYCNHFKILCFLYQVLFPFWSVNKENTLCLWSKDRNQALEKFVAMNNIFLRLLIRGHVHIFFLSYSHFVKDTMIFNRLDVFFHVMHAFYCKYNGNMKYFHFPRVICKNWFFFILIWVSGPVCAYLN